MSRIGYRFTVEGEYSLETVSKDDPEDYDWLLFETEDLHPAGETEIVIWPANCQSPSNECLERAVKSAVMVIDWMRTRKGWKRFCASLWRMGLHGPAERVHKWDLV